MLSWPQQCDIALHLKHFNDIHRYDSGETEYVGDYSPQLLQHIQLSPPASSFNESDHDTDESDDMPLLIHQEIQTGAMMQIIHGFYAYLLGTPTAVTASCPSFTSLPIRSLIGHNSWALPYTAE